MKRGRETVFIHMFSRGLTAVLLLFFLAGCQQGGREEVADPAAPKKQVPFRLLEPVSANRFPDKDYRQGRGTEDYHLAVPVYVWHRDLAVLGKPVGDPGDGFAGLAIEVETNVSQPSMGQVCRGATEVALYPPQVAVTRAGDVFDSVVGMDNQAAVPGRGQCGGLFFHLRAMDDNGDGEWDRFRYSFPPADNSGKRLLTRIPAGEWQLRSGSVVLARFDLPGLAGPPSPEQGLPVPLPEIARDPLSGRVREVRIQWWRYEPNLGHYQQLHESFPVAHSTVALLGTSEGDERLREAYQSYGGLAVKAAFPNHPWYLPTEQVGGMRPRVTALQIAYEKDGILYRFIWQSAPPL